MPGKMRQVNGLTVYNEEHHDREDNDEDQSKAPQDPKQCPPRHRGLLGGVSRGVAITRCREPFVTYWMLCVQSQACLYNNKETHVL